MVMSFPPLPAEGKGSSIGSLTPADPVPPEAGTCTRATKKVILKVKVDKPRKILDRIFSL